MQTIIELFKKIWVKIIVEVVLIFIMWIAYYVAKNLLPKKYRLKEKTLKEFLKSISILLANYPKDDDSIAGVMSKSKSIFEHIQGIEMIMPNSIKELQKFVRDSIEPLSEIKDYNFMSLVFPRLELYSKQELIQKISEQEQIVKFTFVVENSPINFYVIKTQHSHAENLTYNAFFACTKDFKYRQLSNLLFEITDNKLYLSARDSDKLIIEKLEMDYNQKNYILDQNLYDELLKEITEFKNRGIQRSYILNGEPGTGKTTFALEISEKVSGKILKLDSNTFNNLASGAVKSIIDNLTCDFIIVDDIDRIHPHDLPAFLYMLEIIKNFQHKPTLLATVNNIKDLDRAVIRPGRFDDIIEFDYLTDKARYEFIKTYVGKLNTEIPPADIKKIATATKNMTQSYLKEYCLQYSIEKDADKVVKKIVKRKKYLDMMEKSHVDEEDMEDIKAIRDDED